MKKTYLKFTLIGVFNTLFNLILFNLFIFAFGFTVGSANVISLLISIAISFYLNTRFVFPSRGMKSVHLTLAMFLAVTLFTQLVIQQLIVVIFTQTITSPGRAVADAIRQLPLLSHLSQRFYSINIAKGLAVAVSLVLNFVAYDKYVFAKNEEPPAD